MKNMINSRILNMATKLSSGIVTPSQLHKFLSAWRSGSRTMNLHAEFVRRRAWLLLIAGLLPMIAVAQTVVVSNLGERSAVTGRGVIFNNSSESIKMGDRQRIHHRSGDVCVPECDHCR